MLLPSEKQKSFIEKLASERGITVEWHKIRSSHDASQLISDLLARPKTVTGNNDGCLPYKDLSVGVYLSKANETVRVNKSRNTGHHYGEVWDSEAKRFIYTKGIVYKLVRRLTLDEAKIFGKVFGTCCICARTLSDPKSIDAGIGPICAMKF